MNSISSSTAPSAQEPAGGTHNRQAQAFGREVGSPVGGSVAVEGSGFLPLDTLSASVRDRIVGTHCANPHLYNTVHRITLSADQSVELMDLGGQYCKTFATGQWGLSKGLDPKKYTLHIINPEDAHKNLNVSPAYRGFKVDFIIDTGEWTRAVHSPGWRHPDSPVPTLTCFSRLIFDHDPLKLLYADDESISLNLYDVLEKDQEYLVADAERAFYAMHDAVEGSLPIPLTDQELS